ncbi:hypothetical protein LPJ66_006468 [Kickxella alabastrina]|uniref:Uncharacterized protein n=1 Tax=Kickxella alabastrina TaxID=61397 RepID=A0ACC1IFM3_9FUNG|nr:hypothetical protein LPJ66_006468 [Kickxella alabastrina]
MINNNAEALWSSTSNDKYNTQFQQPTRHVSPLQQRASIATVAPQIDTQYGNLTASVQQQINAIGSMLAAVPNGNCAPSNGTATAMDVFDTYALHAPFMSQVSADPFCIDPASAAAATSSGSPAAMPLISDIPSQIKGNDISLFNWYDPPISSASTLAPNTAGSSLGLASSSSLKPSIWQSKKRRMTLPQVTTSPSTPSSEPFFNKLIQYRKLSNMSQTNNYTVRMLPHIDRGFFRATDDWTCYRRNYFQISSTFWMTGSTGPVNNPECPCLVSSADGQSVLTVTQFYLGISAEVADCDAPVELVQHTPKRDKGPQTIPTPLPIRAHASNLDDSSGPSNTVCFERLQFKTATANNGKRRAAQQYYSLTIELYAECANGENVLVASMQSSPVVVRGRSPGHYADGSKRRNTTMSNIRPSANSSTTPLSKHDTQKRKKRSLSVAAAQGQSLSNGSLVPAPSNSSSSSMGSEGGFAGSNTQTDSVANAAAAAAATATGAPRYDLSANEVAHVFPDLNLSVAAVASTATANQNQLIDTLLVSAPPPLTINPMEAIQDIRMPYSQQTSPSAVMMPDPSLFGGMQAQMHSPQLTLDSYSLSSSSLSLTKSNDSMNRESAAAAATVAIQALMSTVDRPDSAFDNNY